MVQGRWLPRLGREIVLAAPKSFPPFWPQSTFLGPPRHASTKSRSQHKCTVAAEAYPWITEQMLLASAGAKEEIGFFVFVILWFYNFHFWKDEIFSKAVKFFMHSMKRIMAIDSVKFGSFLTYWRTFCWC